MGKTFSAQTIKEAKFKTLPLSEKWIEAIGEPDVKAAMIVWGLSASGKTTFVLQLCQELMKLGKVYYNSVEQGWTKSLQDNIARSGIYESEHIDRMFFGDRDTYEEMIHKIDSNRARFIIVDSVQYLSSSETSAIGMTKGQYFKLRERYKRKEKFFIFISHAIGDSPKGQAAKDVRYDVDIKCHVTKGVMRAESRFGHTEPYYIFGKPKKRQLSILTA